MGRTTEAVDVGRWAAARDLRGLADLTALWLEGSISSQPGCALGAGPDEETAPLTNVLAAVNRAGYLTTWSQPGYPPTRGDDGATWAEHPAVDGFIHPGPLLNALTEAASDAGMIVMTQPAGEVPSGPSITVTFRAGEPYTVFSGRMNPYRHDELCSAVAANDVDRATYVAIVDPVRANRGVLWDVLAAIAETAPGVSG